jgi:hypothetical protein
LLALAVAGGAFLVLFFVAVAVLLPMAVKANARMQSQVCQAKLQQLGLGARIHAVNHDSRLPGDWLELTNEFANAWFLVCPDDKSRTIAPSWAAVGPTNITYRYLGNGGNDDQTNRVLAICPVHGHVVVAGGRVYPGAAKRSPGALSEREGATWLDPDAIVAPPRPAR